MSSMVAIKTDVLTTSDSLTSKSSQQTDSGDSFSSELNKHLSEPVAQQTSQTKHQQTSTVAKSSSKAAEKSSSADNEQQSDIPAQPEQEKTVAQDGKKLPVDNRNETSESDVDISKDAVIDSSEQHLATTQMSAGDEMPLDAENTETAVLAEGEIDKNSSVPVDDVVIRKEVSAEQVAQSDSPIAEHQPEQKIIQSDDKDQTTTDENVQTSEESPEQNGDAPVAGKENEKQVQNTGEIDVSGNEATEQNDAETAATNANATQTVNDDTDVDFVTEASEEDTAKKTVLVDEHAVTHAKTQQVNFVARAPGRPQTTQQVGQTSGGSVSAEEQPIPEGGTKTVDNTTKVDQAALKSVDIQHSQAEKALLKQTTESVLKPTVQTEVKKEDVDVIRADILDALKKQHPVKSDIQITEKNLMAAKLQKQVSGGDVQFNKDALLAAVETKNDKAGLAPNQSTSTVFPATISASNNAATGSSSSMSTTTITSLDIQPSVQNAAWSKVMSNRVVWMAKEGIQQAELKLKPAQMGPVEVKVHVQNDQVSVSFSAQHATTREALEQALPKLRDSFAENGIALAHAEVGEQHQHEQQQESMDDTSSSNIFTQAEGQSDDINTETEDGQQTQQGNMGLSLYA